MHHGIQRGLPMNFLAVRLNRCRKCASPCALQGDAGALSAPVVVCPLGKWQTLPVGISGGLVRELVPGKVVRPEVWGPAKWAELHSWALGAGGTGTAERLAWLARFSASLPMCECRNHWRAILRELPMPPAGDVFGWSVAAHNAVNRLKGKAEMAVQAARMLHAVCTPREGESIREVR